jgi:ankyrin repeat protein
MKKLYLEDVIEKYYLGGLVERVKINIKDKTLTTKFLATKKNLVGTITAPNIELEDCEFGVYDTSQLLKLIGITDHFLMLNVEKHGKIANKLLIADNEFNLEYALNNKIDNLLVYLITNYKQINVDYSNFEGNTPLIVAVENDNLDLVNELISRKCSIDKKNDYGNTALIEACLNSNYFLINKLIDSGADINMKNMSDWTPLMFASANKFDDIIIIEYLISKGAICDLETTINMCNSIGNINISDYINKKIEKKTL